MKILILMALGVLIIGCKPQQHKPTPMADTNQVDKISQLQKQLAESESNTVNEARQTKELEYKKEQDSVRAKELLEKLVISKWSFTIPDKSTNIVRVYCHVVNRSRIYTIHHILFIGMFYYEINDKLAETRGTRVTKSIPPGGEADFRFLFHTEYLPIAYTMGLKISDVQIEDPAPLTELPNPLHFTKEQLEEREKAEAEYRNRQFILRQEEQLRVNRMAQEYREKIDRERIDKLIRFQLEQATNGLPSFQYDVGVRYLTGDGVWTNETLGRYWLEKSAAQDNRDAKELLKTLK
jgi:hypothetical protein